MQTTRVGRLRLLAQRLAGPREPTAADAMRWMTCLQAQQLPAARAALAIRTTAARIRDVDAALNSAQIVRSWPMRGTLHFVVAEDLREMLQVTAPLVERTARTRWAQLGLSARDRDRDEDVTRALLSGGKKLSRRALLDAWADAGIETTGQAGAHRLVRLALAGVICFGPMSGTVQSVVLCDEWLPPSRPVEAADVIARWAVRYFRSHGPATMRDFLWWTGLRVKDVRPVWGDVTSRLARLTVDGVEHHLDPQTEEHFASMRRQTMSPALTPAFDEILLGYADRSATLHTDHAERVVPGRNGMFLPVVIDGGRAVGTWSSDRHGDVTVKAFEPPVSSRLTRALPRLARELPRDIH